MSTDGAPATDLGKLRVLASTASIHVSPLALGGMSIGDAWASGMGSMDKESSFKLLDFYSESGGNFIDTSNNLLTSSLFVQSDSNILCSHIEFSLLDSILSRFRAP